MKRIILIPTIIFLFTSFIDKNIGSFLEKSEEYSIYEERENTWVDSVFNTLTLKQKIGQIFMVASFSTDDHRENSEQIEELIKNYGIGGIMFLKGTPFRQAEKTEYYQSISEVPLFISMDAEWGLSMRLDSSFRYPWNLTLGAIQNDKIIHRVGRYIGKQCRSIGVNINFAPVVDINLNYKNPVIGRRSFGEDKLNGYKKSLALFKGMEEEGVMAVAKHFPGHGDTNEDSHKTLPIINKDIGDLYDQDIYPFRRLIKNDIKGIMMAHLKVPSVDVEPTSLSHKFINDILKEKLEFEGLVFSDALNMKSVSENYETIGELELRALSAGNDILLYPLYPEKSMEYIYDIVINNDTYLKLIDDKVRKILKYKYRLKLNQISENNTFENIYETRKDSVLSQVCYENAITILKNQENIVPIKYLNFQNIGLVSVGGNSDTFNRYLEKYTKINYLDHNSSDFIREVEKQTVIILSIHKPDKTPWDKYSLTSQEKELINTISKRRKVILCLFSSPYSLIDLEEEKNVYATIVGYQDNIYSQRIMAQMIFGALDIKGKLPVSTGNYNVNNGLQVDNIKRLSYGYPEMERMKNNKLLDIDSTMNQIIEEKIIPGGQVLVAKNGRVIYSKNFGSHTYEEESPKVNDNTIYDLASITKLAATTIIMMDLEQEDKINLNDKLKLFFPDMEEEDKGDITLKELLAHNSGLISWYPFYTKILNENKYIKDEWYSYEKNTDFKIKIAEGIHLRNDIEDTLRKWIYNTKIGKKEQRYSDIGFFVLGDVIKKVLRDGNFEDYLYARFYDPIGADYLKYKPLKYFDLEQIAPSEKDDYFRNEKVVGKVHDMMAAMQHSTPTNSGLFGNSNDLAKVGQMLLQEGYYGGENIIERKTVRKFNKRYFKNNRKGLGFDKPDKKGGPTCHPISAKSFGHLGFTGTMIWIDPEENLLYIFLSNRTYPNHSNNKLSEENIRTGIQKIIYSSIYREKK